MVFLMVLYCGNCYACCSHSETAMALTDVKIRTAKPAAKAYRLADAGGLYLLVTPSGGKLWRWNYRYDGKQKTMPLGKYPDVSLADAREALKTARSELGPVNTTSGGWRCARKSTQTRRSPQGLVAPSTRATTKYGRIFAATRRDGANFPHFFVTRRFSNQLQCAPRASNCEKLAPVATV